MTIRPRLAALALLVVAATDLLVVAAMAMALHPPTQDLIDLAVFLFGSGAAALAVGAAVPFAPVQRGQSLRWRVLLIPVLVVALALANVGFIGHLMFVSTHDLGLLTLVLLFALVLATVLAFVLSESLRASIQGLTEAVAAMTAGDLRARATVAGRDELAALAEAFNLMAERLEASFQRQQELEHTRRETVAAISHDLRTPLASLRAMAESINDGVVSDPDTVRGYLRNMEAEVARLATMIDDLFELSQLHAGALVLHPDWTDVGDLVSDTLQALGPQAVRGGVDLRGAVADGMPDAWVDTRRLQRVLANLVQNAIRHTPAGGSVSITAGQDDRGAWLQVADTGEGIDPADLPHVFEPFYQGDKARTRRNGGSSGLGLAIVQALVQAHGGDVAVQSTPGAGSTFSVHLPARPSATPADQPQPAPAR